MNPWVQHTRSAVLAVAVLAQAGCKDQTAGQPQATSPAPATAAQPVEAAPQPVAENRAVPAPAGVPQKLPLGVQGVAPAGVTVRVKGAEIGGDATVLDVSISFANRITDTTMLALADTYLEDESGARLHIKRPDGNRDITIREGETLDGQLVFLGRVAPTARKLKLVFNDGNEGDNIVAPGLIVDLPLQGG